MPTFIHGPQITYTKSGQARYLFTVENPALGKLEAVRGEFRDIALAKAQEKAALWNRQEETRLARETALSEAEAGKEQATEATTEAKAAQALLQSILIDCLEAPHALDWEALKSQTPYPEPPPQLEFPSPPKPPRIPPQPLPPPDLREPQRTDPEYQLPRSLLDALVPGRRQRRLREVQQRYGLAASAFRAAQQGYEQ